MALLASRFSTDEMNENVSPTTHPSHDRCASECIACASFQRCIRPTFVVPRAIFFADALARKSSFVPFPVGCRHSNAHYFEALASRGTLKILQCVTPLFSPRALCNSLFAKLVEDAMSVGVAMRQLLAKARSLLNESDPARLVTRGKRPSLGVQTTQHTSAVSGEGEGPLVTRNCSQVPRK